MIVSLPELFYFPVTMKKSGSIVLCEAFGMITLTAAGLQWIGLRLVNHWETPFVMSSRESSFIFIFALATRILASHLPFQESQNTIFLVRVFAANGVIVIWEVVFVHNLYYWDLSIVATSSDPVFDLRIVSAPEMFEFRRWSWRWRWNWCRRRIWAWSAGLSERWDI